MVRDSSPLPIRHANNIPRPSLSSKTPILLDDDELAGDTIPCSPGAVLRHDDTTQPTQILSRPTLEMSSPPSSVIEVPASSPFQEKTKPSFVSRLAPQGTLFRPPQRPTPVSNKRPAPQESIDLISDDEDDLTPPRGDIRPTDFKAHLESFRYRQEADDKENQLKQKLKAVYRRVQDRFDADTVMKALKECDNDVERTINWLERKKMPRTSIGPEPTKANRPRLVSKATLKARASHNPSPASSRNASPSPPPKQVGRRRLIQGLKKSGPSSPRAASPDPLSQHEPPLIIDLVSNDNDDDVFEAERSPTPDDDSDSKVLKCANESTLQELAAMTGMKPANLEPLINKRPFITLEQARAVSLPKKPGSRRSNRTSIGESIVDAIEIFLNGVEAIDLVVGECEQKAQLVKTVMETWDIDSFGYDKRSGHSTPDHGYPPTPTSLPGNSKFVKPPIPRQPLFMDGHCKMKPFQLFGLNWMSLLRSYDLGCILADEMGLGKTCQVISLMSHLVESFDSEQKTESERPWPNLVVVPPSTYSNWLAEFERFAPDLSVIGYRGSASERMEIAYQVQEDPGNYHVVLATYSQINSMADLEGINGMEIHAAVFDEGHKLKNPDTKLYGDLKRIQADWKLLLTGTPVQNNLLEMTSLLNFLNPKIFDRHMENIKYMFSHKVSIRDVSNGAFLYSERVKRARTILEPFILQRRKQQVVADLPQKLQSVVLCDTTDHQKSVYDEYETIFRKAGTQGPKAQTPVQSEGRGNDQNNVWMQLRKSAVHPLLFRRHFTNAKVEEMARIMMDRIDQSELRQNDIKHLIGELKQSSDFELHLWCRDYPKLLGKFDYPAEAELDSGKVTKLLELVEQYQKNGDRLLVFSKFARVIEILTEVLAVRGVDHRVLKGSTNVSERQEMIDEFNGDPSIPVFLLTTGAGGTGINLTSANKVLIFDQSDNPQEDIQAENRAHRLGQTRDVEIIRLITKGTIEELVHKACAKKIELANKVTGQVGEDDDDGPTSEGEAAKKMEKEVRQMMEEGKIMTPP